MKSALLSSARSPLPYRKAGAVGGRLIRSVIRLFQDQKIQLPLDSHILIAVSGGSDSVALAHLMLHFGRKMVQPSQVRLLHINHQWRGSQSDEEARFVEQLGEKWQVPVVIRKIPAPKEGSGRSWEDEARRARKIIFREESEKLEGAKVLTAHHADDLAETLLWRILTGSAKTHGGGILFQVGSEIRPFLKTRKKEIQTYLSEVGQEYHEDPTNFSDRFLRARMRKVLMPEIEKLFPKGMDHLVNLAIRAQMGAGAGKAAHCSAREPSVRVLQEVFLQVSGLDARRKHLEIIEAKMLPVKEWFGEIHMPKGWRIIREKDQKGSVERWILEKTKR